MSYFLFASMGIGLMGMGDRHTSKQYGGWRSASLSLSEEGFR